MKNLLMTKSSDCKSDLDASRLFAIIMSWIFITPATSFVCHFCCLAFSVDRYERLGYCSFDFINRPISL